jgi:hypothetical protein
MNNTHTNSAARQRPRYTVCAPAQPFPKVLSVGGPLHLHPSEDVGAEGGAV